MRADDVVRVSVSISVTRTTFGAPESVRHERNIAYILPGTVDDRKLFDGLGQVLAPDLEGACRFHAAAARLTGSSPGTS